ncbi:MAG: class I SAM-dependent methyltransferase [Pseudomonadota bacterium]
MILDLLTAECDLGLLGVDNDSCRIFHGRGLRYAGLESICVDVFTPVLLVSAFDESIPDALIKDWARSMMPRIVHKGLHCIALLRRYAKPSNMEVLEGEMPDSVFASEHGADFELNFSGNQNVGFFLDAAPARSWVRQQSGTRKVLNLFAYTGSFSVAAIQGGATKVVNVDMSRSAIRTAHANHCRNFASDSERLAKAKFMPYEFFRSVSRLAKTGPFDLIIVDPPSFQPGSFVAKSDYPKLIRKLHRLLRKRALVLAMLNAPNLGESFLKECFAENLPESRYIERLENSAAFPDIDPQRSLKMQVFSL